MSKRKNNEPTSAKSTTNPDSSDDDVDMDANEEIQVAFEWCNFDAEVDFLGLKNLLREQFDIDHDVINLSGLADLILSQAEIGTTVKCGAEDDASEEIHKTDPYAYITILNLHNLKDNSIVKQLRSYLAARFATNPKLAEAAKILDPESSTRPGLILAHRVQNMPHAIAPPLYKMQAEEIATLAASDPSYNFTHYLIHTRCYTQVASALDDGAADSQPRKKTRVSMLGGTGAGAGSGAGKQLQQQEVFQYNVENDVLHDYAACFGEFEYQKQSAQGPSDAKRAFGDLGTRNHGHAILFEADKLPYGIAALEKEMAGAV